MTLTLRVTWEKGPWTSLPPPFDQPRCRCKSTRWVGWKSNWEKEGEFVDCAEKSWKSQVWHLLEGWSVWDEHSCRIQGMGRGQLGSQLSWECRWCSESTGGLWSRWTKALWRSWAAKEDAQSTGLSKVSSVTRSKQEGWGRSVQECRNKIGFQDFRTGRRWQSRTWNMSFSWYMVEAEMNHLVKGEVVQTWPYWRSWAEAEVALKRPFGPWSQKELMTAVGLLGGRFKGRRATSP